MSPSAEPAAVVTIAHGRHDHLLRQRWGLAHQQVPPDLHVVVAMGDPGLDDVLATGTAPACPTEVVHLPADPARLPLAAARNAGVAAARRRGAEHLVLLDVDCIPGPGLVGRYRQVLADHPPGPAGEPVVVCGEVRYLDVAATAVPPQRLVWADLAAAGRAHPARPVTGDVVEIADLRLFWSLSFAAAASSWQRIGGFDEGYAGYGGEDTDFGQRLGAAAGRMLWVDGALAVHQHHESHSPPLAHVADVVADANRFARRWGWWPMEGWLDAFAERGLVERRGDGSWAVLPDA